MTPKNQNWDPSVQALVHGETWSLRSNTSHLIRNDVWAWHVIGGKDEIEDKSNWQCDQVRLRLCTEQKAIIIIANAGPKNVYHTTQEAGLYGKSAGWPRQNLLLFQDSCFSSWWQGRDPIPLLQGRNVILLNSNSNGLSELALTDLKWDSCYAGMNEASLSMGKEEYFIDYEIRTSNSRELDWKILLQIIIALS